MVLPFGGKITWTILSGCHSNRRQRSNVDSIQRVRLPLGVLNDTQRRLFVCPCESGHRIQDWATTLSRCAEQKRWDRQKDMTREKACLSKRFAHVFVSHGSSHIQWLKSILFGGRKSDMVAAGRKSCADRMALLLGAAGRKVCVSLLFQLLEAAHTLWLLVPSS